MLMRYRIPEVSPCVASISDTLTGKIAGGQARSMALIDIGQGKEAL